MSYPNGTEWSALKNETVLNEGNKIKLSVISCGKLKLPSGRLVVCDPFAGMSKSGNPFVLIQPGEYDVKVTLADVSSGLDGSHIREAYASLIINNASTEIVRKLLQPTVDGKPTNQAVNVGEFFGYSVDAGTSCFADAQTIESDMPDEDTWYEGLFENNNQDCWFNQMDDSNLIRNGIANITLPLTENDNNLVLFHSGWGDGYYPVIGGYDAEDNLVAVHTDFFVISPPEVVEQEKEAKEENPVPQSKPWWKLW
jgi:hypothetical protein